MTAKEAYQKYEAEMRKLVAINEKRDWSPAGEMEFHRQREEVYWAKCALVSAQAREDRMVKAS